MDNENTSHEDNTGPNTGQDIQDIIAFGQERGWHVLVLTAQSADPAKGLIIAQPGRDTGILKILVDAEEEAGS